MLIYWFAAQETFLIIINVENSYAAQYLCGNRDAFNFFRIHRWIKSSKEIFWNSKNVFTGTFHQFNASLLNKIRLYIYIYIYFFFIYKTFQWQFVTIPTKIVNLNNNYNYNYNYN